MASSRSLRRWAVLPAAVSVVAASLSLVYATPAASAASGTHGTARSIHLRGQTSTYPKPGTVGHGKAANLSEHGGVQRWNQSQSPRPATTTSAGKRTLAASNASSTSWLPVVRPTAVHSTHTGLGPSWEGLGEIDNDRTAGGSLEPPDQGLCVGSGKVFEIINVVARIYNTNGTPATPAVSANAFFGYPEEYDPTTAQYGPFLADPTCAYDAGTKRFYVAVLVIETDPQSGNFTLVNHVDVAVSKTSNPAGGYYFYSIPTTDTGGANGPFHSGCPCIGDYPHIGLDSHGFYVTTNEYPWGSDPGVYGNNFNGAQVYAMSKTKMAQGVSLLPLIQFENTSVQSAAGKTLPGFTLWPTLSPNTGYASANNGTEYFLSSFAAEEARPTTFTGHDNRIGLWSLSNSGSLDTSSPSLTLRTSLIQSEPYGVPPLSNQKAGPAPLKDCLNVQCRGDGSPYAPEQEGGLDSSDTRFLTSWYVGGKVVGALDTAMLINGNLQAGVAWFQVTPGGSPSIAGQGYLGVANNNVTYPSIATGPLNYGAVALTLAGSDHFPSAAYARWSPSGAGDVYTAAEGVAPQDGFCEYLFFDCSGNHEIRPRWGDYGAAAFDGTDVWIGSEYIAHGCTFSQFNADTTCGNTRTYYGNFTTRVSRVHPGVT